MALLAFILIICDVIAATWLVGRVCTINARLRANLAGCTGYPVTRRLADRSPLGLFRLPLADKGRAAGSFS